jgi:hypothetical protein
MPLDLTPFSSLMPRSFSLSCPDRIIAEKRVVPPGIVVMASRPSPSTPLRLLLLKVDPVLDVARPKLSEVEMTFSDPKLIRSDPIRPLAPEPSAYSRANCPSTNENEED